MDEALDFTKEFMILNNGRLIALGTLEQLRTKINEPKASLNEIFVKLTKNHA